MSTGTGAGSRTSGWVLFVGVYLGIAGVLNALWGIAALAQKSNFASDSLIWSTISTWGWVALIVGVIQIAGALLVGAQRAAGAITAGFLAFLGLLVNFLSLGAYPIWSVILLVTNALILWATTVHSDEFV
ncbi:hypothetical protein Q5424_06730 [Conexibacter sp. JD483]|uniref:DUF7144 family membrane protein n=1 Tax=unclassified Conexibacter TaxID=2627773 RepID=UPI0027234276|nr:MULTISPECIES: hypothetical protein [unclassified Conexibacter]MDO8185355.1 hypothetical protein [Conexibacter sp. CPCC 205706]MDO8198469.1 hypothetical protein [Conexibacter sp. CPCC 205762]MDR9368766.1 hypothetical protein [Conexibacter sp. JD483]